MSKKESEWDEEFDKIFEKYLKSDGTAVHFEDRKRIGLYYTATTIGYAKLKLKEFIVKTIANREKEIAEEVEKMIVSELHLKNCSSLREEQYGEDEYGCDCGQEQMVAMNLMVKKFLSVIKH